MQNFFIFLQSVNLNEQKFNFCNGYFVGILQGKKCRYKGKKVNLTYKMYT